MMLGITAQVKEAGIAWDKGEKKSKQTAQIPFEDGWLVKCFLAVLGLGEHAATVRKGPVSLRSK